MENFTQLDPVLLLMVGTIIIALGLAWLSIKIAPEVGLMDIPGSADHKNHKLPIPVTGGVVLIDTFIILVLVTGLWRDPNIFAVLVSGMFIGVFGLLDDFIHLSATKKLCGQIVGAMGLVYLGVQVNIFTSPELFFRTDSFLDPWLNLGFSILWLVAVTNAFNFIDSSDGLAVGLSGVSSGFFLVISLVTGQPTLIFLCTVILGTCIALYFFNSHPARLFLGDSGAQMLGFLLASIAILYEPRTGNQASTWFVPILIFAVPLFDMLLVTISRLKRNKKIHKASHDHTFHRLAQRGIPIQQSVLIMHGASLILSMIGFLCLNLPVIYANIVFGLVVCLGIAAFIELDKNYP
ncbi:MAG TPA: undecaprenyl/decaprenyl-phosphate alpha-N-acetylglucosaminyl 1-phosphate transferase [Candidatus Marinimicrobia bacterium]|nr:undecaprenyl/decaprenyl-phosphate alpha-N-acetylglucosaminyl 1-phosphate transferase [Candidatus Neomarinimicrobiota bacterium]